MPILPENFPAVLMPLVYAFLAGYVAENFQVRSTEFGDSGQYASQSNWAVARHGAIAFIILLGIAFGFIFCLSALGLIEVPG